ncbi:transcriptional repressor [Psychrobacter sp. I-STPA6b]|uniref:transcriptional repressor n=1 Tax=Psychrobacter sp. I-STPA6b TaxID=2585718 RepID=UPI0039B5D392
MHSHDSGHLHDVHHMTDDAIQNRLRTAEQQCLLNGSRFTSLRRQVYSLILASDKPLGAYDLIQHLQDKRKKQAGSSAKNVAPPTIYRTLEFLLDQGFIHQLTSINAFVPCCHPRDKHFAAFLICNHCHRVQECSTLPINEVISFTKDEVGFAVTQSVMEMTGVCAPCQTQTDSTADIASI